MPRRHKRHRHRAAETLATFPSDRGEIEISVEMNDGDSVEGGIQESIGYLKKNKVVIDKSTEKKAEGKFNEFDSFSIQWTGKDEDGPTNISLTLVEIDKKHVLLFLYWASPAGEKKHAKDIDAIGKSLKKA